MVTVLLAAISKARKLFAAPLTLLTVNTEAPGPVMVMFLFTSNSLLATSLRLIVYGPAAGSNAWPLAVSKVIVPPSHTPVVMASRKLPFPLSFVFVTTTEFEHGLPTVYERALDVLPLNVELPLADPSPVYCAVMLCTAVLKVDVVQAAEPLTKVSPALVPLSPAPVHVIGVAPSRN